MPELPEVEVVRRGLERWVAARTVSDVQVVHPRAVRRHPAGAADLTARLRGATFDVPRRRGKYLWLPLAGTDEALLGHLGMSGQLLVCPAEQPDEAHLRIRFRFVDEGPELRFVDQRTFGGFLLAPLVDRGAGPVPEPIAHIAPDPFEAEFRDADFHRGLLRRRTGLKRALLDQSLISGVGNIYADEALWRAGLHYERPTASMARATTTRLLAALREVMGAALDAGGTSFDRLYVNVNGASGYFDRSLDVYGRAGRPCRRCGTEVRREAFMNRSSYLCPRCQRRPRATAG